MTTPPPALEGCAQLYQLGARVALGRTHEGTYALWSATGGGPFAWYPDGAAGWSQAVQHYQEWERPVTPPASGARAGWVTLVVILLIAAVAYYGYHSYRYQGCLIEPGLFQWPSSCI